MAIQALVHFEGGELGRSLDVAGEERCEKGDFFVQDLAACAGNVDDPVRVLWHASARTVQAVQDPLELGLHACPNALLQHLQKEAQSLDQTLWLVARDTEPGRSP